MYFAGTVQQQAAVSDSVAASPSVDISHDTASWTYYLYFNPGGIDPSPASVCRGMTICQARTDPPGSWGQEVGDGAPKNWSVDPSTGHVQAVYQVWFGSAHDNCVAYDR